MNLETRRKEKRRGFTLVELLVVMSIIMILLGLLLPAMNQVRRYSRRVKQKTQFHGIDVGLELYKNDFDGYPDSDENFYRPSSEPAYCGAMKLAEAMVGRDLLGYHPSSNYNQDGQDDAGNDLYYPKFTPADDAERASNLKVRKGPYVEIENANANSFFALYGNDATFGSDPNDVVVICDEYPRVRSQNTGKRIGMPVLYYKADVSKTKHEWTGQTGFTSYDENIYDYRDNIELVDMGLPWDAFHEHAISSNGGTTPDGASADKDVFYTITQDDKITNMHRPMRPESYILLSAGYDGVYGTDDDVFNFGD